MFRSYILQTISFDYRSLAFFRIMLGFIVVVDLIHRATLFEAMYTDDGITPLADLREIYGVAVINVRHFSLHMIHEGYFFQAGMFILSGLCALCLTLGWNTRLFAVASWVLHVSLRTRNPVYGSSADALLGAILFWAMFLPLGGCFSIDRLRRRSAQGFNSVIARTGGACYLLQICVVYLGATYIKGEWWRDGLALIDIMKVESLSSEFGNSLTQYPTLLSLLTCAVYYIEAFGTMLLFVPYRRQVLRGICTILFLGLHGGIAATCDIGLFPYISMVSWLPFVPGAFWQFVASCLDYRMDTNDMIAEVTEQRITGMHRPASPLKVFLERSVVFIAVFSMAAIVLWTTPGVRRIRRIPAIGEPVSNYLTFTKLKQNWGIFSRPGMERDGWFVIQGTLHDGREVDILRNLSPVEWSKPPQSGRRRLSIIWRTYLAKQERYDGRSLGRLATYLNRKQLRSDGDNAGFRHIRMVFVERTAFGPGEERDVRKIEFWSGPPPG